MRIALWALGVGVVAWVAFVIALLTYIPRCEAAYRDFGIKLPAVTEWVIGLVRGLHVLWPFLLLGAGGLTVVGFLASRLAVVRRRTWWCWERVPAGLTGRRDGWCAAVCEALAERLATGEPLAQAWAQALDAVTVPPGVRQLVEDHRSAVTQPAQLADALRRTALVVPADAEELAQTELATWPLLLRLLAEEGRRRVLRTRLRLLRGAGVVLLAGLLLALGVTAFGLLLPFGTIEVVSDRQPR